MTNSEALTSYKKMGFWERNKLSGGYLLKKVVGEKAISVIRFILLFGMCFMIIQPILNKISVSFMTEQDLYNPIVISIPEHFTTANYRLAAELISLKEAVFNSFFISLTIAALQIAVCTLVGYGFARFEFPFKKILFALFMSTLFLPQVVIRIPLYLMWKKFGLLDTYVPLIATSVFANEPFFVFMIIQFLRSTPTYLDEAATLDGCNSFQRLIFIILPVLKPTIVSCLIFQFIWSFNDFLGPLIYITSLAKYPVSLALKMSVDTSSGVVAWNQILAMSFIALLPAIILYFVAQKYFTEGIAASGVKG